MIGEKKLLLPATVPASASTIRSSRLLCSAYTSQQLPPEQPRWPEVAVLGRSNVGKSSLINYLLGDSNSSSSSSRDRAKVSKQPGRTTSINFYLVNSSWCLVDCPGYGYARTSAATRADWHTMSQDYLRQRRSTDSLADVLLLVDASLAPRDMDLAGVAWLAKQRLPVTLIFTKCDKRSRGAQGGQPPATNILAFRRTLEERGVLVPPHFATMAVGPSSSRRGRQELLNYLARRVAAHKAATQQQILPTAAGTAAAAAAKGG